MKVAILMGSESDDPKLQPAYDTLTEFGVDYDRRVISAHRAPELLSRYVQDAPARGITAFICAAGMAAHLAGAVAAQTTLPVIGIPIGATMNGLDALLATVQMPPGVPVATVAIDGSKNAALLAIQILALSDNGLAQKLQDFKKNMADRIAEKVGI